VKKYFKYDNHKEEWRTILNDEKKLEKSNLWKDKLTLDSWRHDKMRNILNPIINSFPRTKSWLTIGDGRYGSDANFLLSSGLKKVHSSDISDALLKIGNKEGFIKEFSAQNAENIKFENDSFDFVFCKEALHHCPRPFIALDQMFRVCREAIILIEPRDQKIDNTIFHKIFNYLKNKLSSSNSHFFEEVGNYQYKISSHELEKFLLGMHYRFIGTYSLNDYYEKGIESIKIDSNDKKKKKIISRVKFKIKKADFYTKIRLRDSGIIGAILFKKTPSKELIKNLSKYGWKIKELPKNPFI